MKALKTVNIDTKKGIYEINGRDVSETCHELELTFKNGEWTLAIKEKTSYFTEEGGGTKQ